MTATTPEVPNEPLSPMAGGGPLPGERKLPSSPDRSDSSVPALAKGKKAFPSTWLLWVLLIAITGVAAYLRFWRLGYQAYWTDEGYTMQRVSLTYKALLNSLADQGFPPGWYAMLRLWRLYLERWIPVADTYEPQYLRMLPAFLGTLTVPAMYLLARQFTDRKGALLVMLLAAVNPFFVYYSRDIKMYAGLMFFATLNMALFFQWQTTRKHLLYFPLFVLSGVAMSVMHSMAMVIPALQFIFILTRPRPRPWDAPLWMVGAGVTLALPFYWYIEYTKPANWAGRVSNETDRGLGWIQQYTDMSWRTLAGLPTSHILGYLWPVNPQEGNPQWARINNWFELGGADFTDKAHLATRSWAWMVNWQWYAALGLFAILLLGLIPWRGIKRHKTPERAVSSTRGRWWWILIWIVLPSAALALTWLPTHEELEQRLEQRTQDSARIQKDIEATQTRLAGLPAGSKEAGDTTLDLGKKETELKAVNADIDSLDRQMDADWFDRIWGKLPKQPKPFWEPRYLGIIVPAWLLWLGASLRRMPTWPVRTVLITAVVAACAYSSLFNQLFYRNAPFNRPAETWAKYVTNNDFASVAVAVPDVAYPHPSENSQVTLARHVVPESAADELVVPYARFGYTNRETAQWPTNLSTEQSVVNWLKTYVVSNAKIKTLVLTDRYGDITSATDILSDDSIKKLLGDKWELKSTEKYEWHYEWRFYIFHTWRTRVWQLKSG